MKLAHWSLMGGLLHLVVYSKEGPRRIRSLPRPLVDVSNAAVHPSTASVPFTILLYDGLLLCGFNVPFKGLK